MTVAFSEKVMDAAWIAGVEGDPDRVTAEGGSAPRDHLLRVLEAEDG